MSNPLLKRLLRLYVIGATFLVIWFAGDLMGWNKSSIPVVVGLFASLALAYALIPRQAGERLLTRRPGVILLALSEWVLTFTFIACGTFLFLLWTNWAANQR